MLTQSTSGSRERRTAAFLAQRSEEIRGRILAYLGDAERATVAAISQHVGVSNGCVRDHLKRMREEGDIRVVPSMRSNGTLSPIAAWAVGRDEGALQLVDQPLRLVTKAAQINMPRDPLVAALFGPAGKPRCVACHLPQGAGHKPGCKFSLLS